MRVNPSRYRWEMRTGDFIYLLWHLEGDPCLLLQLPSPARPMEGPAVM